MHNLREFIPLSPLHEPFNLDAIEVSMNAFEHIPQVACFDTSFHRSQPRLAELFALPLKFADEGIIRYGFHGLLDVGVILYLMGEKGYSQKEVEDLLYKQSGLKGVSNISSDMRTLLESNSPDAKLAIDLFCYTAAKHLGSLLAIIGGLDILVLLPE
jgi:acetate kinase